MDIVSTDSNVVLECMVFDEKGAVVYVFSVDGNELSFSGWLREGRGIRSVEYSEGLEEFVMGIMPFNRNVSKMICQATFDYSYSNKNSLPLVLL